MGLRADIYKAAGRDCSNGGLSSLADEVTIVNVEGPFEPSDAAPAVLLDTRMGRTIAVPAEQIDRAGEPVWEPVKVLTANGPMNGGCYVGTSDSRFSRAAGTYGAVPLFDRFETPRDSAVLSE